MNDKDVWALVIQPDGSVSTIEGKPELHRLQHEVGGYIEAVGMGPTFSDAVMFCNEEGKLMGLPMNKFVTALMSEVLPDDIIMGAVVITGPADKHGEITRISSDTIIAIGVMMVGMINHEKERLSN